MAKLLSKNSFLITFYNYLYYCRFQKHKIHYFRSGKMIENLIERFKILDLCFEFPILYYISQYLASLIMLTFFPNLSIYLIKLLKRKNQNNIYYKIY